MESQIDLIADQHVAREAAKLVQSALDLAVIGGHGFGFAVLRLR